MYGLAFVYPQVCSSLVQLFEDTNDAEYEVMWTKVCKGGADAWHEAFRRAAHEGHRERYRGHRREACSHCRPGSGRHVGAHLPAQAPVATRDPAQRCGDR